jgi:hypothetical protein
MLKPMKQGNSVTLINLPILEIDQHHRFPQKLRLKLNPPQTVSAYVSGAPAVPR